METLKQLVRKYLLPVGIGIVTLLTVLAVRRQAKPSAPAVVDDKDKSVEVQAQAEKAVDVNAIIADINKAEADVAKRKQEQPKPDATVEDLVDEYSKLP